MDKNFNTQRCIVSPKILVISPKTEVVTQAYHISILFINKYQVL